jgi:hypothetical protein
VVVDGNSARSIGYLRGGVMCKHRDSVIHRIVAPAGIVHRFGAGGTVVMMKHARR